MRSKMNKKMGPNSRSAVFVLSNLLFIVAVVRVQAERKSLFFDGFNESDSSSFSFEGGNHSFIFNGALQLTPETRNEVFTHNRSGRIMYNKPFRLWSTARANNTTSDEQDHDMLASFNTTFVINIYREETWDPGHGLAFLIAPNLTMPSASHGQWLGLTNASTDSNPSNHILAIEFDTQMQEDIGDPNDNHIGLNINSVRSEVAVPLNMTLSPPPPGTNHAVWIYYNGTSRVMEVYMVKQGEARPRTPLISHTVNLKDYLNQDSYFGFSASTGNPELELNCVLKWSLDIDGQPKESETKWVRIGAGVGAGVVLILIVVVVGGVVCLERRRRKKKARGGIEEGSDEILQLKWLPGMPRVFKYNELKKATNNFDESMKLGEGGFGVVYRGVLILHDDTKDHESTSRREIAVKKFSRDSIKSKDDFLAELTIIHRLRHKHLVRLVGWCHEKGKLLLAYDFMPNGSLEKHLYGPPQQDSLSWTRRFNILVGIVSALHYLHNEFDQKVVHRDLKSSNILLDADFNARLGDFGLARALENERNSYAELGLGGVLGTFGYIAPECFHTGKATPESDIFGFGAVVLEVVCGKGPGTKISHNQHLYTLVDWVWILHREGRIQEAVDERLGNDFAEDEAKRLLLLGLACSHPIDSERPKTESLLQIMSGTLSPPRVPPFKPVFTWPSMSASISGSSLSGMTLSNPDSIRTQSH